MLRPRCSSSLLTARLHLDLAPNRRHLTRTRPPAFFNHRALPLTSPAMYLLQPAFIAALAACCIPSTAFVRVPPSAYLVGRRSLATSSAARRDTSSSSSSHGSAVVDAPDVVATNTTRNFITNIIDDDIRANRNGGRVVTRFPPEPNGYLHLGHAKSICFNFGVARQYNGVTHMRMDDTNPAKEEIEYVESILQDVKWLVGDAAVAAAAAAGTADPWHGPVRHASDYFDVIHDSAVFLIQQGLAYVDDLTPDEMKAYRGTLTEPGKNSPHRARSVEDNLRLFADMRSGKFPDGHCVLRAKIDMSSPNMNLRDPTLYRIKRATHPITGDAWCIYPMYDFAHAMSDALEGITHSLCTLEFADHRPLYDWAIDSVKPSGLLPYADKDGWRPAQTEFSRLNLQYTVLSKRKLIQLVTDKHVEGWDDPRMPTISGVRRRGYPASAIRLFCERMGVSKAENNIDIAVLEDCVRDTLDAEAPRALAIAQPLKVTIANWPTGDVEVFTAERHPKRPEMGARDIPFSGAVYIDKDDFFDTGADGSVPVPKGYKRLVPGGQVRLKYAYVITCDTVVRGVDGQAVELICSYDPRTRAGATPEGAKKAKGIVQWVSQAHAVPAELALFDRLFTAPSPGRDHEDGDFLRDLNPHSLTVLPGACVEPSLASARPGDRFQFERLGYFCVDIKGPRAGTAGSSGSPLVFNRVVTLKDTWAAGTANDVPGAAPAATAATATAAAAAPAGGDGTAVASEDVLRIELRVGLILSAERHPDAESLYVEKIDVGEKEPRTVISGLAKFMPPEALVGRRVVVVCNLKPSKMRGILSEGMVLAASAGVAGDANEVVELLSAPEGAAVGELVQVEGLPPPTPDPQLKSKTAQDAWKRVAAALATDADGHATYTGTTNADAGKPGDTKPRRLLTSAGPCAVPTLKSASIR